MELCKSLLFNVTNVRNPKADSLYRKSDSRGVESFYLSYHWAGTKYDVAETDGECAQHLAPDQRAAPVQYEATQYGGRDVSEPRAQQYQP